MSCDLDGLDSASALQIPNSLLKGLLRTFKRQHQQLISQFTASLVLWQTPGICLPFHLSLLSIYDQLEQQNSLEDCWSSVVFYTWV